jgi:hypothetical protein
MSGYFDKLIQSYQPEPEIPGPMPWISEEAAPHDPPNPATDFTAEAPSGNPGTGSVSRTESVGFEDQDPNDVPPVGETDRLDQVSKETQPIERVTERVTDRIIERLDEVTPHENQTAEPADTAASEQIVAFQELHETHFHVENTQIETVPDAGPSNGEAADSTTFVPDDDQEPEVSPEREVTPRDAELAELQAHLAKALSEIQASHQPAKAPIIEAADFEPDDSADRPPAETETVHEITREIVKEIHHHHETQTEPRLRTVPKSADEASQIGWIRFASAWDRPGGSW